ncbi:serine hydroxymethyltransferase [Buchnera aphidicola str. Bp (Baizongia pistaciae)]|uniref:Serine hydroxymethyltransferase n=1 Tax=Buchnera aphidicola subsp. Baizongia pistaciae (strain Bp) TaxID=224915 RepID=GLYA_BUCBP|nr:serine hydroxymethyltransferase [Buchnera aphidicola]P59432.1 RecName: Full=Serine hydroxymethyltransferase; Short=SHMT; Short=Serine methylase [Buchnera aphidicola str. Bp (Baizongia pistaciae)]AAO26993.1 serine hydroxymethyltransferase [Buchnera aphidicola str. Bp (Baizongia pistaciae)]
MFIKNKTISNYDADVYRMMKQEYQRQENHIELIASENYVSSCVMEAQGSQLTNKYAEGYPGKRYYGGCDYVDAIEKIAIKRAKKLFNANYANVQPHSGSQANYAVYSALLKPNDIVLGMSLSHGGHLTHGSSVNFSGKLYKFISYGLDISGDIDYPQIRKLAHRYKPKMIVGGFSAYSGICNWKLLREIADEINSYLFVDMAHISGLVAAGLYPNPLKYAHVVTSTTHKTLSGPRGGLILAKGDNVSLFKKLNSSVFPGCQGGPLMHVIAAKAIAFKEAMEPEFKDYQYQVIKNAQEMAKTFISRGYKVVSGKTFNHLLLLDLSNKNITGKRADILLHSANIIVNKNSIPNDLLSPFITSGIRIGTPAITRRGFTELESRQVSNWICDILDNFNNIEISAKVKQKVLNLCSLFPVYK